MKICEKESLRSNSNRLSEKSMARAISVRRMNDFVVHCGSRSAHCVG